MKKFLAALFCAVAFALVLNIFATHARVQSSYAIFSGQCFQNPAPNSSPWYSASYSGYVVVIGTPGCWDYEGTIVSPSSSSAVGFPMPSPGTLSNLTVYVGGASSGSGYGATTVYVNGSASALTCSVSTGTGNPVTCSDTTDTVSVATGDLVIVWYHGTGSSITASFEKQ